VAIKATTMEGKGVVGRKEGIEVQAVVLIYRVD
jgi:2C-methyl-D-erythritol 2,4-cyclodiphosphate synthase